MNTIIEKITSTLNRLSSSRFIAVLGIEGIFALAGFVAAQGGPLGYIFLRWLTDGSSIEKVITDNKTALAYIWIGTTIFFSLFGYLAGTMIYALSEQTHQIKKSKSLLKNLNSLKRQFYRKVNEQLLSPVSLSIEFLEALKDENFGPVNSDQKQMAKATLLELIKFHKNFSRILDERQDPLKSRTYPVSDVLNHLASEFHAEDLLIVDRSNTLLYMPVEVLTSSLKQILSYLYQEDPTGPVKISVSEEHHLPEEHGDNFVYFRIEVNCNPRQSMKENISWLISKNIFENHGGFLWHDTEFSDGIRLYIAIPKDTSLLAKAL